MMMFSTRVLQPKQLRRWLLAAIAAVLLLACLEAGHVHSATLEPAGSCLLCQANLSLDKVLPISSHISVVLFLHLTFLGFLPIFVCHCFRYFPPARAPPIAYA